MDRKNKLNIKIVIVFMSFCQVLHFAISPVLNKIHNHYSAVDISLVQMLISAPALLSIVVAIISGWLVVKISKKTLLLFGSFIIGITGLIPLLFDSFVILFCCRILFGVGLGIVLTLNTTIVAEFFEGKERISVLGLQGASVGAGMLIATTLGGILGSYGFQYAYYVHIIGLIAAVIIWRNLPDTEKTVVTDAKEIQLNRKVYKIAVLTMIEFIFLISFSTNIAMHLSGDLTGNSTAAGILTGIFSGTQIVVGLILNHITKYTKKYTFPIAMLSFSFGSFILILFPSTFGMLILGAIFCGISQGVFMPRAMYRVSNVVKPVAVTMAVACLNVGISLGQLISPTVLNNISRFIFGEITTTGVYTIAALSTISIAMVWMINIKRKKI